LGFKKLLEQGGLMPLVIPKIIIQGGWVMIPIILGSVLALAFVLERVWFFISIRTDVAKFASEMASLLRTGHAADAIELCHKTKHPIARVFEAGLSHVQEESDEIERVMEREGNRQIGRVEKNLNYLVVIIGIEPLLGFLGTILGLIQAFMAWEKFSTSVTVANLAAGIYQAMITTAAGLIVAIPYFVIYNIFLGKVNAVAQDINHYGDEFLGVIAKAKK
jgi:biopolymer transport protein ExbB